MKTLAALVFLTGCAMADARTDRTVEKLSARLHYDTQATAKLREVLREFAPRLEPLRADAHVLAQQIRALLARGDASPSVLKRMTDKLANDRSQIRALSEQRMAELKARLSPEQYAELVVYRRGRRR